MKCAFSSSIARPRASMISRCIPSIAETAKTVVSTVHHGTLSTLSDDGTPLGTYVAYVLGDQGVPLLRLRANSVHKYNVERRPRCSLFVQASKKPARRLARVTLIGSVALIDDKELPSIREQYLEHHRDETGVDRLIDEDRFATLRVDKAFYIGGLTGKSSAEVVEGDVFLESQPDPLRSVAPDIVHQWNTERMEDIYRLCKHHTGIPLIEMVYAELAWVDRCGFYIAYDTIESKGNTIRVPFPRTTEEDRDARSLLTMAAHLAWEADRNALPL